jgi:hypothetical protein
MDTVMSGGATEVAAGSQLVLVDRATLLRLARMARRLCPDRRDPERFHIEKDAIERELRRLASVGTPVTRSSSPETP